MWHDMWGWAGSWGWFGAMHLLWWVFLIGALVLVFRALDGRRTGRGTGMDRALRILRERYARGEIDQVEYDERVRHLTQ